MQNDELSRICEIWRARNYDLGFYFQKIFNRTLKILADNTETKLREGIEGGRYKALFVPVGYSIEITALLSAFIKPDHLTFAFTEKTLSFHRRNNIGIVENNIKKICPDIRFDKITILSDDQKLMEHKIVNWIEEIKSGYGLSYVQMAIDLTGGTKPMSIGAHNAAISFEEVDAFYLKAEYDEDTQEPIPGTETLIRLQKGKSQLDETLVFVIMPFRDEFNNIYYEGIKETVEGLGLKCIRVDEEIFHGGIMDKTRENIIKAKIIIAELTEHNANVYYELGLSHGYSKKVIMLTQDVKNIPFDLRHKRLVIYNSDNKPDFRKRLLLEIKSLI